MCRIPHSIFHLYTLSLAWCGTSVHKTGRYIYTFIYIIHNVYTPSLFVHVRSLLSLVPISLIFSRCICTRGPLANQRTGLLRLAVSPASLRGWHRRRLTPSPYILHYILPHTCRIPHSVSVSAFHLYSLSLAWCGPSVHKTGRYLYTFIYIIHNVYTPSLFVQVRSLLSLVPISLHPHAWSSGQSTRGVAEVGRKPRLTSWMASLQTNAISVHFPLHFTPHACAA